MLRDSACVMFGTRTKASLIVSTADEDYTNQTKYFVVPVDSKRNRSKRKGTE